MPTSERCSTSSSPKPSWMPADGRIETRFRGVFRRVCLQDQARGRYPFLRLASTLEKRRGALLERARTQSAHRARFWKCCAIIEELQEFLLGEIGEREGAGPGPAPVRSGEALRPHGGGGASAAAGVAAAGPGDRRLSSRRGSSASCAPGASVAALLAVLEETWTALAGGEGRLPSVGLATSFVEAARGWQAARFSCFRRAPAEAMCEHWATARGTSDIVEIDGAPVLFDAIEFDDAIATVDVLYDLAFLLMDLGARGLREHANAVLNAYLEASGDTANLIGLAALPLFLSTRAMVRAKVELLRASLDPMSPEEARRRATSYVLLARDYLERQRPQLIAIGGLSGSGKSSVAQALAPHLGVFPGCGACAERCRTQATVRRRRGQAAALACLCRGRLGHRLHHVPQRALMALEGGHSGHRRRSPRQEGGARRNCRDCGAGRCRVRRHLARRPCETMWKRIADRTGDVSMRRRPC